MTTTFQNSGLKSNMIRDAPAVIPSDIAGDIIEISFPTRVIGGIDLVNKPASTYNGYTANTKTMVQNMFNSKNLNEKLNFKNTYYLDERGDTANKEANTIYGYDKVYPEQTVDADLKAQYTAKVWKELHIKSEKKVKDALRETTANVNKIKENEEKIKAEEQARHSADVRGYFKRVQQLVGTMTGAPQNSEKFNIPCNIDESEQIGVHHIDRNANDEEGILNNRANIRTVMGARSMENQEKVQAEKEAKEKILALQEAQKAKVLRQEEMRISKYMDLQKLSQTWRIPDKEKLKGVVRNEVMKDILKEEERKNFDKIGKNTRKSESPKRSLIKKKTAKIEPPKAWSPSNKKKKEQQNEEKKYTFSPQKIKKLPKETQEDYRTRFNFTVMAMPQQKESLDPLEQHQIMKKFQEMLVKSGVERNGRIALK